MNYPLFQSLNLTFLEDEKVTPCKTITTTIIKSCLFHGRDESIDTNTVINKLND
jgi:hypothetical protein